MKNRELYLTAIACHFVIMWRDELVAGTTPQWKSAALLSLNLTMWRFGYIAFLVMYLSSF